MITILAFVSGAAFGYAMALLMWRGEAKWWKSRVNYWYKNSNRWMLAYFRRAAAGGRDHGP